MDQPSQGQGTRRMIGIVAASGGVAAVPKILAGLPREFTVPIVVVQAIPPHYLDPLVAKFGKGCLLNVVAAEDGQVPEPGKVYVATGSPYLVLEKGCLRFEPSDRNYQSNNVLFRSMARELGPGAIAVILTGMGRDGAEGMKEVRDAGGYTIAQDESTSVVYSKPRFAVEINAACESLPLKEIAPRLLALAAPGPAGLR